MRKCGYSVSFVKSGETKPDLQNMMFSCMSKHISRLQETVQIRKCRFSVSVVKSGSIKPNPRNMRFPCMSKHFSRVQESCEKLGGGGELVIFTILVSGVRDILKHLEKHYEALPTGL